MATELLDDFTSRVFFVDLAPIRDPELVAATIAQTIGVLETGAEPLAERLKTYLRERQLLMLLDNFEQVLLAAPLVVELLAVAPGLKAPRMPAIAVRRSSKACGPRASAPSTSTSTTCRSMRAKWSRKKGRTTTRL